MRTKLHIRKVEDDDLREIFILGQEYFGRTGFRARPWRAMDVAETLSRGMDNSFVAVRNRKITGFIIGSGERDDLEQKTILIRWLCPGSGSEAEEVGDALLSSFIEEAKGVGYDSVCMQIPDNKEIIYNVLKKFGFTEKSHAILLEIRNIRQGR